MKIEEFKDIKIAYMRRVGKYGLENKHLMETFNMFFQKFHHIYVNFVFL